MIDNPKILFHIRSQGKRFTFENEFKKWIAADNMYLFDKIHLICKWNQYFQIVSSPLSRPKTPNIRIRTPIVIDTIYPINETGKKLCDVLITSQQNDDFKPKSRFLYICDFIQNLIMVKLVVSSLWHCNYLCRQQLLGWDHVHWYITKDLFILH